MSSKTPQVEILFEDNHLLVVNKPPLLPTMGVRESEDSLYRWAGQYLKQKYNKPGNVYVGIVSRLDAHVSGVIVLARTSKAASRLSDQMRRGVIVKRYVALVPDGLKPSSGRLVDRLIKNESLHRMQVVDARASHPGEKEAALKYRTILQKNGVQAIEIELETGRKHQIRVQLENAGFPILGDRKYGSQRKISLGIGLHCFQLVFEHPTQRTIQSFCSEPPDWWPVQPFEKSGFPVPRQSAE
ncbi:MAG: RNA pseudouridine synthase [Planctomycetota bacterium]